MQRLRTTIILTLLAATLACDRPTETESTNVRSDPSPTATTTSAEPAAPGERDAQADEVAPFAEVRSAMVEEQLVGRDIDDERVLEAMRSVPRHLFVLPRFRDMAYTDRPLPIGHDQTISQPYIVAKMTQELNPQPTDKVLEIGTGSGYQAAVLSKLVDALYTIEIVCPLAEDARTDLAEAGLDDNVTVRCGDGYAGWPDQAPFEKIIVTAAPPEIPEALIEQLAPGGRMVLPVGDRYQELKRLEKDAAGETTTTTLLPVRFVPMVPGEEKPSP